MEYSCNHLWHRHFYMGKTGHKHKELKCAWGKITLAGHIFLEWSAILIDHLVRFVIIKLASSNYPLGSLIKWDRRGRDRMVFTATYAITYHHKSCEFPLRRGVLDTTLCDMWFSPLTPVSSTNKTDRYDMNKILLKVGFNTIQMGSLF